MLGFHKPINININLSSPFFKHWNIRKPGRLSKYCLVFFSSFTVLGIYHLERAAVAAVAVAVS